MLLVVPLAVVIVLAVLRIADGISGAVELDAFTGRVTTGQQVSQVVDELQRERALATGYVGVGRSADPGVLEQQFAASDDQVVALRAVVGVDPDGAAPAAAEVAYARLRGLTALRDSVRSGAYPDSDVVVAYNAVIATLLDLSSTSLTGATPGAEGGALQRDAAAVDAVSTSKEQISRQHASLLPALAAETVPTPRQLELLRDSDAQFAAALGSFANAAGPEGAALYGDTVTGAAVDDRERIKETAVVVGATGRRVEVGADRWDAAATENVALIGEAQAGLLESLRADSAELGGTARATAVRDGLVVGLLIVLALLLLVYVARSLLRPLRSLQVAAFDIAQRRLPHAVAQMKAVDGEVAPVVVESIGIDTREEIGEVARAFDAVHREAVRLATQQALLRNNVNDIFVNLSRRSQVLVRRQLRLIDELENGEENPEQLGNLFQLDHLATRMRRNNENLLVLAGADLRQRRRRPVAALDVLRAAVSEVEEYSRVVVQQAPAVSIAGSVVNDLVHLVAELLDNAAAFSPPDTRVVLSAASHGEGGLLVEITDNGVGIEAEVLAGINDQLVEPPTVDAAVSRQMGLFVVGRLAERHDITVRLQRRGRGPGLVACVEVPAAHLTADATTPALTADHDGWTRPEPTRPGALGRTARIDMPRQPAIAEAPEHTTLFGSAGVPAAGTQAPATPPPGTLPRSRGGETAVPSRTDRAPVPRAPAPAAPALHSPAPTSSRGPSGPGPQPVRHDHLIGSVPAWGETEQTEVEPLIFEEMRSAWFRQRRWAPHLREIPNGAGIPPGRDGSGYSPIPPPAGSVPPAATFLVAVPPSRGRTGPTVPAPTSTAPNPPVTDPSAPRRPPAPATPETPVAPRSGPHHAAASEAARPVAVAGADQRDESTDWGVADEGWRVAESASKPAAAELTGAGLPRRQPQANLVPGAAGPSAAEGGAATRRDPDVVRGLLSRYQGGLRAGRELGANEGSGRPAGSVPPGSGDGV